MRERIEEAIVLELDLLRGLKTGEPVTKMIPFGPEHTHQVRVTWEAIERLRRDGVRVHVDIEPALGGVGFVIEDRTPFRSAA